MRPFTARVVVFLDMRVAHVRDAGQRWAEFAPVVHHARERDTAEIDAVVRALPRDEHRPAALSACLVIGERNLHRRVDRLGT